jgi:hypothetical protein
MNQLFDPFELSFALGDTDTTSPSSDLFPESSTSSSTTCSAPLSPEQELLMCSLFSDSSLPPPMMPTPHVPADVHDATLPISLNAPPLSSLPAPTATTTTTTITTTTAAVTTRKGVKHARSASNESNNSSDGLSSGDDDVDIEDDEDDDDEDDEDDVPRASAQVKRKGRRAAAEIILERVGDVSKLNAPPVDCDPAIRRVALTRERLLTISGEELEQRFDELSSKWLLTASENKELRRQRRLVKNREYAQQSRNKKKAVVASVDSKFDQLQRENDQLRSRIAAAVALAHSLGAAGAALVSALAAPVATASKRRRTVEPSAGGSGGGGAVLMVMLLSFGLFLNGGFFQSTPAETTRVISMSGAPAAAGAPKATQYTGRTLLCESEPAFGGLFDNVDAMLHNSTLDLMSLSLEPSSSSVVAPELVV